MLESLFDVPLVITGPAIVGSSVMWAVILVGAFIGLVMFMICALDRPFRGDLGLPPDPYRSICDHLMEGKSRGSGRNVLLPVLPLMLALPDRSPR